MAQASNHKAICEMLEQHATYQTTRTKLTEVRLCCVLFSPATINNIIAGYIDKMAKTGNKVNSL